MSAMQGALSAAERSMRSVFVGNIPYEATEEQLKDIFAEVGPVVSFRLVYDRETGKPKGYGFCEYKDQEMALSAMRNLNGYELNGRALRVDNAASEKSKEELKNLQASLGGPPVESPFGPEVNPDKAPDQIARVMSSLPPEQLYELMTQIKMSIENNPIETRSLLIQNPQLTYALLQAQVIMGIVEPETAVSMLHSQIPSNQTPIPPSGLLPTPEEKIASSVPQVSMVNDVPSSYSQVMIGGAPVPINSSAPIHAPNITPNLQVRPSLLGGRPPVSASNQPNQFHGMMPAAPPGVMNQNPPVLGPRITSAPQARPSLLGDRPVIPNSSKPMPNQFPPDRIEPRGMGDHDLRVPPMIDRDMRQPPMMIDKDMRQPLGDQDLRTLNAPPGGMPENRQFDSRYRGGQVTDLGNHGTNGPPFDRPRVGPGMDSRAGPGMDPRAGQGMDPRAGQGMDPRAGQGMDPRAGQGMDPRAGQGMDPRAGQGMDPRAGPGMVPRAGQGMDPRAGQGLDPRAGPGMDPRPGLPERAGPNTRSQYDGRPLNAPPRNDDPRNSSSSNPSAARMHLQNPRVAAVNSGSPQGNSPNVSSPRQQQSGLAAAAASIAPHDQEKANLIMQVLQLSDQQIALLPPEQRQSIMVLKEQIARTQNV